MSLSDVKIGDTVKVIGYSGGNKFRQKLLALGIMPGIPLRIIEKRRKKSPILVSIMNNNIMLGYGIAKRIKVSI